MRAGATSRPRRGARRRCVRALALAPAAGAPAPPARPPAEVRRTGDNASDARPLPEASLTAASLQAPPPLTGGGGGDPPAVLRSTGGDGEGEGGEDGAFDPWTR